MKIQLENCGCYVARYKGLEIHEPTLLAALTRTMRIIMGLEIDPRDIPL